jgi:hypothetical protein
MLGLWAAERLRTLLRPVQYILGLFRIVQYRIFFFETKEELYLDNNWVHQHVTSTMEYTTYI